MRTPSGNTRRLAALAASAALLAAGCSSVPSASERRAHVAVATIAPRLHPTTNTGTPALPGPEAGAEDYLRYALLRHPRVAAAFDDWRASVDAIAPARALPDPQLTFQADIARTVMSLMPGVMFDIMSPGKRDAMGREAVAMSDAARRRYEATIVETASEVRLAWAGLSYADEEIVLRQRMATLVDQLVAAAQADYSTGQGTPTIEEQAKWLDVREKLRTELENARERRTAARARFKSALGLLPTDPDPAWPTRAFPDPSIPDNATLWSQALAANPELAVMSAEVEAAVAQTDLARRSTTPDFSAGLMADLKADPLMLRPTATMSLPVWRAKTAGLIASAESRQLAARERLGAARLELATELADRLSMLREATRMADYLRRSGIPTLDRTIAASAAAYEAGQGSFLPIASMRLERLGMELELAGLARERSEALARFAQLIAADVPAQGLIARNPSQK